MKPYPLFILSFIFLLGSYYQAQAQNSRRQTANHQKDLREFLRYQRHYQGILQKIQDDLLEKDESLQGLYSESVISEELYLEANQDFEKLEAQKLAQLPENENAQKAVSDLQIALRKAGQPRDYYTANIQRLSAAKRYLASLRESLKEDEEVKEKFDQLDALEKKYLGDARKFEDLMIKALANNPKAQTTQALLDSCSEISRLLQRIVTTRDSSLIPTLKQRWQTFIQLLKTKGSDQEKILLAQLVKRLEEMQKGRER